MKETPTIKVIERFSKNFTIQEDGCWAWHGALRSKTTRRGVFKHRYVSYIAYRFLYEIVKGPIGENLTLDHLCENPNCVNPKHLEPVTHQENMRRRFANQTHCKHGHILDTPDWAKKVGRRYCNTCHMLRERTRNEKRRQEVAFNCRTRPA